MGSAEEEEVTRLSIGPVESSVLTVLFLAAPVVLAILLARWLARVVRSAIRSEARGLELGRSTAREVLDERYARCEIGCEEYERIRRDLTV